MNKVFCLKITAVLIFLSLVCGCVKKSYFSLIDVSDASHPEMCLSTVENCYGFGVLDFAVFVAEVDERGRFENENGITRRMWEIRPAEEKRIKKFKYGEIPVGWTEAAPAKPLQKNTFYTVNGEFYFRILTNGERNLFEVYSFDQFFEKYYID